MSARADAAGFHLAPRHRWDRRRRRQPAWMPTGMRPGPHHRPAEHPASRADAGRPQLACQSKMPSISPGLGQRAPLPKGSARRTGTRCLGLGQRVQKGKRGHPSVCPPWSLRPSTPRLPRVVGRPRGSATPHSYKTRGHHHRTCGETCGNRPGQYLADLCRKKQMAYAGCVAIVMPENYIALFSTPTPEQAAQIIAQAEPVIDRAIHFIQQGRPFPQKPVSALDRVNSSAVNRLFYPLFVHARKFYVTDACISCGRCASVCPLNNIQMKDGNPSGAPPARTAWRASAAAPKMRSNTAGTAAACPATPARKRSDPRAAHSRQGQHAIKMGTGNFGRSRPPDAPALFFLARTAAKSPEPAGPGLFWCRWWGSNPHV